MNLSQSMAQEKLVKELVEEPLVVPENLQVEDKEVKMHAQAEALDQALKGDKFLSSKEFLNVVSKM
jgi:hypothetical protein